MLSKRLGLATAVVTALVAGSCSLRTPWHDERANEVNVSFTFENNLVTLHPTVRIDNQTGRFLLGTAAPNTVVDHRFPLNRRNHVVQLHEKDSTRIAPERIDLQGVADAIVGADAWRNQAISIDYHSGLVTFQKDGIERSGMATFRFRNEPAVTLTLDGRTISAVIDTASPDTLVLPGTSSRGTAQVALAGVDFGAIDVRYANIAQPRVGNRLLSRFLVSIDYGRKVAGLWRDPRTMYSAPVKER